MEFNVKNNNVRKNTFTDIPQQFPGFYRDDGPIFVDFVRTYYEWADNLENDFRDAYNIRDIDTTYERFLIYFKNKYLANIPLENSTDIRFVVKHIQDLYRRKGSEESMRLLFRLFFNEEIEIFYPATNILRVSDSIYGSAEYIEMQPVSTFRAYPIRKGDRLFGDTSKATAFVDEIVFRNFNGVLVPILFLSNTFGSFIRDDGLVVTGQRINEQGESFEDRILPGRIIRGSIDEVVIQPGTRTAGNRIGDILNIVSVENGTEARCVVTDVTDTTTGVIKFTIDNAGFGYSANNAENEIIISNQVMVVGLGETDDFEPGDIISANTIASDETTTIQGNAEVVAYDSAQRVLFLNTSAPYSSFNSIPTGVTATIQKTSGSAFSFEVINIATRNSTANFEIGALSDTENVIIITDIIGDFVNVPLNSTDYGMTGLGAETLNTTIRDAFTPQEFIIGGIKTLTVFDEGIEYRNDVKTIVRQPEIAKFQKRNIGIVFDRIDFVLQQGDVITQQIEIEDLTYQQPTIPYEVRASFVRREGEVFFFELKSFFGFDNDFPVNIRNNEYQIETLVEDENTEPMGANAVVRGVAEFQLGQVETVSVLETGFRYRDGEAVRLVDSKGNTVAQAQVRVRGSGFTEGRWTTTTSFLNESSKVIRDNNFYQEYSYEVSTIVNPELYDQLTKDLVQVAGTKQFNAPLINTNNDMRPDAEIVFEVYDLIYPEYIDEDNISEDVELMIENTTGPTANAIYVAVVATLDEDTTNTIQAQIEAT